MGSLKMNDGKFENEWWEVWIPLQASFNPPDCPLATLDTDLCVHQASGKLLDQQVREPVSKIDRFIGLEQPWKMIGHEKT